MYYDEHSPAHFHAKYENYKISVEIETGIVKGKFPKREFILQITRFGLPLIIASKEKLTWKKKLQNLAVFLFL